MIPVAKRFVLRKSAAAETNHGAPCQAEYASLHIAYSKFTLDAQRAVIVHGYFCFSQGFLLNFRGHSILLKRFNHNQNQDAEKDQRYGAVQDHALLAFKFDPSRMKFFGAPIHHEIQAYQNGYQKKFCM